MADDPDDVDARFAELVAQFDDPTDGVEVSGPDDDRWRGDDDTDAEPTDPGAGRSVGGYRDPLAEDEPFVPPTPPPLPRGTKRTRWALTAAVGSPVAYFLLWATGRQPDSLTLLVLVAGFVGGVGVLVAGMRTTSPDEEDDDGAVV